jgi:ketosteroid isomerase-like protein
MWREAVRQSFDQVAEMAANARIGIEDQQIHVHGDMAYELGVEFGTLTMAGQDVVLQHRVTNIHVREAGGSKLVHHHRDLSPKMLDVLKRV